ncbi:hypothetical protein [Marinobacter sp. LQ44]|uniref:hypothetical protein n=1 Tax=unclassified Marinobacter TaxID=83889 RepID=UPI000718BD7F|nr:hypothetical protein [Marinobacter sp. LQ44]AMQ90658.1 hypothetical protein ASQ50_19270 [Marinobacter sp. LQ44]
MDALRAKSKYKIALISQDGSNREELVDALQTNAMDHELSIFSDSDSFLESIESPIHAEQIKPIEAPNLILIIQSVDDHRSLKMLCQLKRMPVVKTIPVIVFCPRNANVATRHLYQLGAASVIRMPLSFSGMVEIIKIMEEYWFKVATQPLPG